LERQKYCQNASVRKIFDDVEAIRNAIYKKLQDGVSLTSSDVKEIVSSIVFSDIIKQEAEEAARKAAEDKMTLGKYIDLFVGQIKSGERLTEKGTLFAPATILAVKQACEMLKDLSAKAGSGCHPQFGFGQVFAWSQSGP